MTIAAAALAFAAVPVSGYHIDGNLATATGLTAGDWTASTSVLIACESNGANDDRLTRPAETPGQGGLCTTGRNDSSGEGAPSTKPAKTEWTQITTCDDTVSVRNGGTGGFTAPGANCAAGSIATIGFTLELGTMYCEAAVGQSVAYNEWYAWMTYTGDGTYTTDDAPGAAHGGDGSVSDLVDVPAAWHGHVAMFIDTSTLPTGVTSGSADAQALAAVPSPATAACEGAGPLSAGNDAGMVKV